MSEIVCTVKEAKKKMEHLNNDDIVILTIIDKSNSHITHSKSKRIKKKNGEEYIEEADIVKYQDNDIFGRFSLFKEKDIVQNILFPQQCTDYWTPLKNEFTGIDKRKQMF